LDLQEAQHRNSPPTIDEIVKQMGDKLTAARAAKPVVESGAFLYSTLPAIVDYASQSPASLELMLQAYVHAAKNHSTRVSNGYGTGTEAAIGQLNWWIAEEADLFNPPLQYPQHTGKSPAKDVSNLWFQEREVQHRFNDVLDRVQEWRKEHVRWTLMSAAMGRCYALNLVRGNKGKTAVV
jgi:hypothetical protein